MSNGRRTLEKIQEELIVLLGHHSRTISRYTFINITSSEGNYECHRLQQEGLDITDQIEKKIGELLNFADSGEVDWSIGNYDEFRERITSILTELEGARITYKGISKYAEEVKRHDRY